MRDYFKRLELNYKDNPAVKPLNIAIHPKNKTINIFKVNTKRIHAYRHWVSGIASLDSKHLIKHGVHPKDISQEKVKCRKLMEIIDEYSFYDFDILQIDTEGFDAEIFKMLDFELCKPKIIKLEWNHMKNLDKDLVIQTLVKNGYQFAIEAKGSDLTAWTKKFE
jgi:FkbM family methyltransferase